MSNIPHNTYLVSNTDATGDGSLSNALSLASADIAANATTGDGGYFDEVTFAPGLSGMTISTNTPLVVDSGVIVDGTAGGAHDITISGSNSSTVFTVPGIARVDGNALATINNLTIADGYAKGAGGSTGAPGGTGGTGGDAAGGIFVQAGHLSLSGDTFNNNTAYGGFGGPGGTTTNPKGTGGTTTKGAGGTGGNAAGAVYVEPGAVVDFASNLVANSDNGYGGLGGFGSTTGDSGTGYQISNDSTIDSNTTCFVSGTLIHTAAGDVAVEDLVVGDLAVTASGAHRRIRWIGHRTLDCRGGSHGHDIHPIRVSADAFGAHRPARDLFLSPGHPVLVGDAESGHLVPIMCLINGTSVQRVAVEQVTYWHVELDAHDILLAEGLPAESYLDWGDRAFFTEGSDHALANPDFVVPGLAGRCRPVAVDGPVVEAERRRLDTRFAMRVAAMSAWPAGEAASIRL